MFRDSACTFAEKHTFSAGIECFPDEIGNEYQAVIYISDHQKRNTGKSDVP